MKNRVKKSISLLLAVIMLLCAVPVTGSAAYENTYTNTGNQRNDIIGIAKTQIGYAESSGNNNKYGAYFGSNYTSWCAYFIVWCARQANIGSSIIKLTGWADADDLGVAYKSRGSYTPLVGDIIIFDYPPYSTKTPASSYGDHVGLVEYVSGGYVHTIEGNSDNAVRRHSYSLSSSNIKGYGVPNYKNIQINLNFNANGGTGSMSSQTVNYGDKITLPANKFSKTGYTFNGWFVKRNNDNKWYTTSAGWCTEDTIKSNGYSKTTYWNSRTLTFDSSWTSGVSGTVKVTFYAQWVPNKLQVYYNANGASITSDMYKISSNIIYYKSDSTKFYQQWTYNNTKENGLYNSTTFGLYKKGYHFTGWGTSASGGTLYDDHDSTLTPLKLSSDIKDKSLSITLYAQWEPNTVNVYYRANGGTVSSDTYKVSSDYIYTKSDSVKFCQIWTYNNSKTNGLVNASTLGLQRQGYTFAGWSTSASGGTVFDQNNASIVPTDFASAINNKNCSVTMYAQWMPNKVTMHFQSAGELLCQTHTATNNGKLVTKYTIERTNATQLKFNGHTFSVTGNKTATLTYGVNSDRLSIKDAGLSLAEHKGCGYIAYRDYDGKWRAYINGVVDWYTTEEIGKAISKGTFDGYNIYAQSGALKTTSPKGNIYFYAVWVYNHTHNYVLTDSHDGSCTEASYSIYTCSCGDSYKINSGVTGHSWALSSYPATCEKGGCSTRTCMKCGISETTESEPLGHDYKENVIKEPTCTTEGEIEYKCSRCEKKYTESIPQVSHNYYIETVIEPTCTSDGYTITKCSECGEIIINDYTAELGHSYEDIVTMPNCIEPGYTTHKCSRCSDSYVDNYIAATGHTDTNNDGKCDICGTAVGTPSEPEKLDTPSETCNHICHKSGIARFFYLIARLFWKMFKTNKYCSCGAAHY